MTNLTRFDSEGIEIFINQFTGESFASLNGVARMAQKSVGAISKFIGVSKIDVISTKVNTPGGLQGVSLLSEDDIVNVLAEYNIDRLKQFGKLGVRLALHQIAGYQQPIRQREQLHIHDLDVLQLEFLANCCFLCDEDLPAVMKDYIPEVFWFLRKEGVLLEHLVDRHRELLEKRKLEVEAQNWMGVVHQAEAMRNGAFKKGIFWEPNLPELVEQQAVETIAQNKARIEIRQKEFQKKSQNKKYIFQVAEFQEQIDRSQIAIASSKQQKLLK